LFIFASLGQCTTTEYNGEQNQNETTDGGNDKTDDQAGRRAVAAIFGHEIRVGRRSGKRARHWIAVDILHQQYRHRGQSYATP
jgi:hypothetical protein